MDTVINAILSNHSRLLKHYLPVVSNTCLRVNLCRYCLVQISECFWCYGWSKSWYTFVPDAHFWNLDNAMWHGARKIHDGVRNHSSDDAGGENRSAGSSEAAYLLRLQKKLAAMWNVSRRNKSRLVNRNRSWLKGEEILKMAKTRKITCCDMKTKPALPKQQAFKTSKTGRTRNDRLISMWIAA